MPINAKTLRLLSNKGVPKVLFENSYSQLQRELFLAQGLEIELHDDNHYRFATTRIPIDDAVFCIVDIETNGSRSDKHQVIEIGAVKVQNHTVIDRYESLVKCNEISSHITEITGIDVEMTQDAPELSEVMAEFRLFLGTDIFVAHAVKFDYNFISAMMERCGYEKLLNRKLCTIDLAERTITSYRYGLSYLNDQLELYKDATHHRALSDAITAAKLFKHVFDFVPKEVKSAEDLVRFSKEASRLKRPKFDPAYKVEEKPEN
ncbi:MAG: 3'-5' exonuclease [Campylobacterota bacterium]|nr:3'-5' exonuclease [Campylobacterota bacterium]